MVTLKDTGFVEIGAQRLEYRFVGPLPGKAPTLVLLHEGLGCVGLWNDFPDSCRLQPAPAFWSIPARVRESSPAMLPRPLSDMHDEPRETLRDCSMPSVSTRIAGRTRRWRVDYRDLRRQPSDDRVGGLVLIAPHFFTEDPGIASIMEAKNAYETGDLRARLSRWHADVDNAFKGWNGAWLDPEFRKWDITEFLAYIRVPVLIVQGEDDQYGTAKQIEIAQQECYCPVEVALLPSARHSPQRDAPDATLKAISEFVARVLNESGEISLGRHARA